jgi:putative FmdB family regulatory protein
MPIYEFTCQSCGLRFEHLFRRVSGEATYPCPNCEGQGTKQVSAVSFSFKHPASQRNGPLPPNTGTSDDWNFDKAIGHDASEKWAKIHENNAVKDKIVREEAAQGRGISRDHLVRKREGGYRVVEEGERQYINQNRDAAHAVSEAATKQAKEKK